MPFGGHHDYSSQARGDKSRDKACQDSITYHQYNRNGHLHGAIAMPQLTYEPFELTHTRQVQHVSTGLKTRTLDQQHSLE